MGLRDLLLTMLAVGSLIAQARPSFEAVSIKPSASSGGQSVRPIGERVVATDATLRALVQFAYRSADGRPLLNTQIIDAPRWAETDRFNVQARAAATSSEIGLRQLRLMTQVMLEDRFQLKTHRDMRELLTYDLATAKGGIKMKRSPDQTPTDADADPLSLDRSTPPRGKFRMVAKAWPSGAITLIVTGTAITVPVLVNLLQQYLDRPIVNSSRATGLYDVQLEFAFTQSQLPTSDEPVGASIFTAVQEQLGLKLDAVKRQIEVLVIDRAEHPAAD